MKAVSIFSFVVVSMVLCALPVNAVSVNSTRFVGNVEGLWYYENTTAHILQGFMIGDASGDGISDAVISMVDESTGTLYIGALSGSGRIAFNNSTQVWGWLEVKNFSEERDAVLLIDDTNGDGVSDIAVTNDSVGSTHVRVSIISGKTGALLKTNVFAARDVNFYYTIKKTIDIKLPADGIGELLLVMNHSVPKTFGFYTYYENYLRVYAINPVSGNSIWTSPIDRGPVYFLMDPTNPYLVTVTPDVSGNNKPDLWIVSSGLNMTIPPLTFNNSEISVIDCQNQNLVWQRKDLASGIVLDLRVYDFTGDGIFDAALSKVSIGMSGFNPVIAGNYTEVLYGNNGTIASKLKHDSPCLFTGLPFNSLIPLDFGMLQDVLGALPFVDFTGDNVPDLVLAPFDFSQFMGLPPAPYGNLTLLNVKANTTVWQTQINTTMVLAFIYPADANGDGVKEVYTVPLSKDTANTTQVFSIHSGSTGTVLWSRVCPGGSVSWMAFASALSTFSDLNADSMPDFVFVESLGNVAGYENVQITAVSGPTGSVIYQEVQSVAITPYANTSLEIYVMQTGDLNGDGKNDLALYVYGETSANSTLSYSYALNGTDGSAMWYCVINSTVEEQAMIFGAQFFGALSNIPLAQCDLNGNGLLDDVIVGGSSAVFVVYTIPGPPVTESLNLMALACVMPVALLTILLNKRKEERI